MFMRDSPPCCTLAAEKIKYPLFIHSMASQGAVPPAVANFGASFIPAKLGHIYKFMSALTAEELEQYCDDRMARYAKLPEAGAPQAEGGASEEELLGKPTVEKLAVAEAAESLAQALVLH
jgi:hypothetical protein